ncbi:hypothetical protein niasHT_010405 [Heterodera trifolii]|uniref:MATH domain-containing protein n=1 Tax=Heterodera trifolii TaxID=157864 RepID=A0ABD2MAR0_9BILA
MFRFDAKNEKAEFASANYPVEVTDVEASAFKVMLSFIYTGDLAKLNGDNAMAVLYAAKKYNISALVDASLQVPISSLRNVFLAYAQAGLYELENFANDCLAYIDRNADNLFKSDAFLQIDQKLLCEILGHDELQIDGEISIWKAFHSLPNYRWISDGLFPMQFPINGRISNRKTGTILMDIENVSEFAREAVDSIRYSEKVYINGMPWKIMAQIKTKNGSTDNEKWLGFNLFGFAREEGPWNRLLAAFFQFVSGNNTVAIDSQWQCFVRSATFRIVSQKKGAENSTGTLCDHVFNESIGWGFKNFISFAELMDPNNGFYDKSKDKVTLAIDVITDDESKVKNSSKSTGTISMEIEKVSEFSRETFLSERKSETVHIKGFPWKIKAQIEKKKESTGNEKFFGFYLWCDASEEAENWSCKSLAIFRIVSQKSDVADFRREFNDYVFYNKENNSWGYYCFISFAELMDPSKGLYNKEEDKVILSIDVTVKEAKTEDK